MVPLEIWKVFNKTKIFYKNFTRSTKAVVSVACVNPRFENNNEAFFISSSKSFNILGTTLVIVPVPKCAVCIFLFVSCVPLVRL